MITILLQKILDVIKAYITSLDTKLTQIKDNLSELIVVKTATGSIANFTTSLTLPLVSAKFAIKATGGNGTSSPIALNGFTGLNVTKTGKNLVVGTIAGGSIGSNGSIAGGSTQYDMVIGLIVKGVTYAITTNESTNQFVGGYFTTLPQVGSTSYDGQRVVQYQKTFTAPITGYVVFRVMTGYEYPQLEIGTTATDYIAPVTPTVYPITFPAGAGTVYGGEIDVLNGKLKPCKYYASYNDETIVGPYLSSTSDLSAGAEVVDFGSFDEEVDIDTTSITALVGVNNIWGDTNGNAEIEYLGKFQEEPEDVSEVIQVNTITVNEVI